jgi:hypothetical protein
MEAGTGVTQSQVKEEEDGSSPGAFGGSVGLLHLGFELALLNYELIDWVVLQASPIVIMCCGGLGDSPPKPPAQ